ncbi:MAG: hypothetical protein QG608_3347 [Actinomycetota bacterium]|nr:hypothetical protein [Actinomycetota bacterium]
MRVPQHRWVGGAPMSADQDPGTGSERPQAAREQAARDRAARERAARERPAVPGGDRATEPSAPGKAPAPAPEPDEAEQAGPDGPDEETVPAPEPEVPSAPGTTDVDSAFAELVAHLSDPVAGGVGPWSASEDTDDPAPGPRGGTDRDGRDPGPAEGPEGTSRAPSQEGPGPQVLPALPYSLLDLPGAGPDEDLLLEEFVPPDPPPLPPGDRATRLAWYGVLGGPAFLLLCAMFWKDLPTWMLLAAIGSFLAGFVALVARLPSERPDDPDDGAVV